MAWVRIDDQFTDHPKAADAGPLGIAMQVAALCYANRHLTDGFISHKVAARLLDFTGIAIELPCTHDPDDSHVSGMRVQWLSICDSLVDAGLWEVVEGGWQIHDYLEYNPSRADTLAKRAADLERKRTPKRPEETSARIPRGIQTDSKRPVPDPVPVPRPVPDPLPEEGLTPPIPPTPLRPVAAPPARAEKDPPGFAAFWETWPKKEAKADALARWKKLRPDADTIQAILDAIPRQQAAKDWPRENWRYCPLPASWLHQRRWEDEIPDPPPRGERELIGKDKERFDVALRAAAKRGYELAGTDPTAHTNGREVSHQPLRVGDGRVPR